MTNITTITITWYPVIDERLFIITILILIILILILIIILKKIEEHARSTIWQLCILWQFRCKAKTNTDSVKKRSKKFKVVYATLNLYYNFKTDHWLHPEIFYRAKAVLTRTDTDDLKRLCQLVEYFCCYTALVISSILSILAAAVSRSCRRKIYFHLV